MGRRTIIGIVLVVLLVIFAILYISISIANNNKGNKKPITHPTQIFQSISGIVRDPLVYDGLNVQVEGNVNDWVTKKVFTLSENPTGILGNGGASIPVIASKDFGLPKNSTQSILGLGDTSKVLVKGRVTIMDRNQLGEAIGFNLDGEDVKLENNSGISTWTRGSVILLSSVTKE